MKNWFCVFMLSVMCLPALGQESSVNFSADTATYIEEKQQILLEGSARIERGGLDLTANLITIFVNVDDAGAQSLDYLTANENVKAVSDGRVIISKSMTYSEITGVAVFKGDVKVKQGTNTASAQEAELDIKTGIYTLNGPVRGTIKGTL